VPECCPAPTDKFSDILIRDHFIQSRRKQIRFKTAQIKLYEKLYFAKSGLQLLSLILVVFFIGLFLYYGFSVLRINNGISKENSIIKTKEKNLEEKGKEEFGIISADIDQIIDTGKIYEFIQNARKDSLPIFEKIGDIKQNTFTVDASLTGLSEPFIGASFTVESEVYYRVSRASDSRDVFAESISASGTAQFGESLIGTERLRIAKEYAIKENISLFIERIVSVINSSQ